MPQRTNTFQEVVAIIHAHLAELSDDQVEITESKMLTDLVSGESREVDTCLETHIAGHKMVVSIESRDWKRKQTVEWVEQAIAKHQTLATNRLVLVSSSGFTGQAHSKAKTNGITLLELDSEISSIRAEIVGNLNSLWVKRFDLTPTNCKVIFGHSNEGPDTLTILETDVFRIDGTPLYSIFDLVEFLIRSMNIDNDAMRDATGTESRFALNLDPAHGVDPESGEPLDIYMNTEGATGSSTQKITRIEISGNVRVTNVEMHLKHGKLKSNGQDAADFDNTGHAYGTAVVKDTEIIFVATENAEGKKQTSMRSNPISAKAKPNSENGQSTAAALSTRCCAAEVRPGRYGAVCES
ncbi:hypothetical protein [Rhodococcus artemisiae]|uniref:Restriction endonuclease n=1 Tax=Rhodococcus artemisiae TaxID=714159 RepID=A0ABU7LL80_9NOCA|nr:hypothetical protein [Rhodococcus artemisiae]MEE2062275.1 hypothetical protein [Rhodococcus artemisiae]